MSTNKQSLQFIKNLLMYLETDIELLPDEGLSLETPQALAHEYKRLRSILLANLEVYYQRGFLEFPSDTETIIAKVDLERFEWQQRALNHILLSGMVSEENYKHALELTDYDRNV